MSSAYSDVLSTPIQVEPVRFGAAELMQQRHYDRIADEYAAHYSDFSSLSYRHRFIYEPMFENISLQGMNVLDAMCGMGDTTEYLIARGAHVTGLDISTREMSAFRRRWPEARALCRSLLDSKLDSASFDCVAVVGGLHHLHPHLEKAVWEIHRILQPGGHLCFMEPHSGSLPDLVRRIWYKCDPLFSDNEAAIDIAQLQKQFSANFKFNRTRYRGNLAFLFVLNSMIFRAPLQFKPIYSPFLLACEEILGKVQTRATACFALGQWQKK